MGTAAGTPPHPALRRSCHTPLRAFLFGFLLERTDLEESHSRELPRILRPPPLRLHPTASLINHRIRKSTPARAVRAAPSFPPESPLGARTPSRSHATFCPRSPPEARPWPPGRSRSTGQVSNRAGLLPPGDSPVTVTVRLGQEHQRQDAPRAIWGGGGPGSDHRAR